MLKVGVIGFTNAFPLFYALQEKIIPHNFSLTYGSPVEINRKLATGDVDVALISSVDFLNNRFSYILLSDLGIATTEEVMSVKLFYKGTNPVLHNSLLYIPGTSATSVLLLKTLCSSFWKVSPQYQEHSNKPDELFKQNSPFVLIGDSCLSQSYRTSHSSIDLAQAWNNATGKSFVFAVIATRNDAFQRSPEEVIEFHRLLEQSYRWGQDNKKIIIEKASRKTTCSIPLMEKYFSVIEYRLTSKHFHGLDHFAGLSYGRN